MPDPDRSPDIGSLIPRSDGRKLGIVRPLLVGLAAAFVVGAHVSPLAHWADTRSFAAHMAQHLLVGDLAPLVFVIALRGALRGLVLSPALTFPIWLADLAAWHVPAVYEAALHHVALHALQHVALFAGGVLVWAPVLGLAPAPRWFGDGGRLLYLLLMMFAGSLVPLVAAHAVLDVRARRRVRGLVPTRRPARRRRFDAARGNGGYAVGCGVGGVANF